MTENITPAPPAPDAASPQASAAPQYPAQPPTGYDQPAPQPYAQPAGYGQAPAYPQHAYPQQPYPQQQAAYPPQYAAPGQYPQQPQPGQYMQPNMQPTQYVQPGQWVPARAPRGKSSGHRVAAGILSIVLGCLTYSQFASDTPYAYFLAFLSLVVFFGSIASGIVLLAKQRSRGRGAPITVLSFAGFAVLVGLIHLGTGYGVAGFLTDVVFAAPVLIVMGLGLKREKLGL